MSLKFGSRIGFSGIVGFLLGEHQQHARRQRQRATKFYGNCDANAAARSGEDLVNDVRLDGRRGGEVGLVPSAGGHFLADAISDVWAARCDPACSRCA
jgi:hypothetical protein